MSMLSRFATLGGTPTDPYWNNVSYLLVGNGANGTTTNIKDSSSNNLATTIVGSPVISTAISPPAISNAGNGTVRIPASGNYLTTPSISIGSGNFTIEFWAYPTTTGDNCVISNYSSWPASSGYSIWASYAGTGSRVAFSGTWPAATGAALTANSWSHVALVRIGTTVTFYINGVSQSSFTSSANLNGPIYVGAAGDNPALSAFIGYLYDIRITSGVGRYTANFTPPPFPPTSAMPTQ